MAAAWRGNPYRHLRPLTLFENRNETDSGRFRTGAGNGGDHNRSRAYGAGNRPDTARSAQPRNTFRTSVAGRPWGRAYWASLGAIMPALLVSVGYHLDMGHFVHGRQPAFSKNSVVAYGPRRYPSSHYLRTVPARVRHTFTAIQVSLLALLWILKTSPAVCPDPASLAFLDAAEQPEQEEEATHLDLFSHRKPAGAQQAVEPSAIYCRTGAAEASRFYGSGTGQASAGSPQPLRRRTARQSAIP